MLHAHLEDAGSVAFTSAGVDHTVGAANVGCLTKLCCCCCCCSSLLAIAAVALVLWFLPGLLTILLRASWCQFTSCFNLFNPSRAQSCQLCKSNSNSELAWTPVGVNGIPLGYFATPLTNLANVTIFKDPQVYGQSNIMDWDSVWRLGSDMPAATWDGTWWRGNELGFVVNNPVFWSDSGIYPASIVLGSTPRQHSAIRPFFEEAFAMSDGDEMWIRESARAFLAERRAAGKLEVPQDLQGWVHQVLHKVAFNKDLTWVDAQGFVGLQNQAESLNGVPWQTVQQFLDVQNGMVAKGTISQALPAGLYALDVLSMGKVKAAVGEYIQQYMTLLQNNRDWATRLANLDCSPSPSCALQFASGLWDALYSAGGLSVPGGIATGLGVLFSTHQNNPRQAFTIPPGEERRFFWESIRFYAPVYGFPFWRRRPTCAGSTAEQTAALNRTNGEMEACPRQAVDGRTGFSPVNQWQGGQREVLVLATAQRDKEKWGVDANDFVLRPLIDYETNSVGFAEMASDRRTNEGRMDRNCPGKELALAMGSIFFEVFDTTAWTATEPDKIVLDAFGAFTQVTAFTLTPR